MKAVIAWVRKYNSGKLVGYADVRFALREGGDGCLTIRNWPIFKNDDGSLKVGMPSEKTDDGYKETVSLFFKNEDAQALLEDINHQVTVSFNNTDSNKPKPTKNVVANNIPTNLTDDELDIPF